MDYIKDLGVLALGGRLKRLSDTLLAQAADLHALRGLKLDPGSYPVISLIAQYPGLTVSDLTKYLGLSQPAVSQKLRALEKQDYILTKPGIDARQKCIHLSPAGEVAMRELQKCWADILEALHGILGRHTPTLLKELDFAEGAFEQKSIKNWLKENVEKIAPRITDYTPAHREAFRALNTEWITKFAKLEVIDEQIFADPAAFFIQSGGAILVAEVGHDVAGVVALKRIQSPSSRVAPDPSIRASATQDENRGRIEISHADDGSAVSASHHSPHPEFAAPASNTPPHPEFAAPASNTPPHPEFAAPASNTPPHPEFAASASNTLPHPEFAASAASIEGSHAGASFTFEIDKMAVSPTFRGQGIGKLLMQATIERAWELGADHVILYTMSRLGFAPKLFKQLGFQEIPIPPEERALYTRADMKMVLKRKA